MTFSSKISPTEIIMENDKINDTKEFEASKRLTGHLIDQWNDQYPNKRIDPAFINFISEYMRYSYVAGYDDYRLLVERSIERSINERLTSISTLKFRKLIQAF